jgi:hypothetical protein
MIPVMKRSLFLAISLALTSSLFAGPVSRNTFIVTSADTTSITIPGIAEMLQDIINITGLQTNFRLKASDVMNIETSITRRKRMIYYNPAFIDYVNRCTGDKWGTYALLAHEIGHHQNGHTLHRSGSTPDLELEADEYAGFVLYKLGATLEQAQEVMYYISNTRSSKTHPARKDRMSAIRHGWERSAQLADSEEQKMEMEYGSH